MTNFEALLFVLNELPDLSLVDTLIRTIDELLADADVHTAVGMAFYALSCQPDSVPAVTEHPVFLIAQGMSHEAMEESKAKFLQWQEGRVDSDRLLRPAVWRAMFNDTPAVC